METVRCLVYRYAEAWCNTLVQKVISQKRSEKLVNEAMLFLVELEQGDKALVREHVVISVELSRWLFNWSPFPLFVLCLFFSQDSLFVGCKHKMPKFHLPCITVIHNIVVEFGIKPFKVETFKGLPEFCDHKDSNVRSEAKSLIVLLAAW